MRNSGLKRSRSALEKSAYRLRKMDFGAVNETLAEMNAEPVVDTRRHITTDVGRDTWQDTSEVGR